MAEESTFTKSFTFVDSRLGEWKYIIKVTSVNGREANGVISAEFLGNSQATENDSQIEPAEPGANISFDLYWPRDVRWTGSELLATLKDFQSDVINAFKRAIREYNMSLYDPTNDLNSLGYVDRQQIIDLQNAIEKDSEKRDNTYSEWESTEDSDKKESLWSTVKEMDRLIARRKAILQKLLSFLGEELSREGDAETR